MILFSENSATSDKDLRQRFNDQADRKLGNQTLRRNILCGLDNNSGTKHIERNRHPRTEKPRVDSSIIEIAC